MDNETLLEKACELQDALQSGDLTIRDITSPYLKSCLVWFAVTSLAAFTRQYGTRAFEELNAVLVNRVDK